MSASGGVSGARGALGSAGAGAPVSSSMEDELYSLSLFHDIFVSDESQRRAALDALRVKLTGPSADAQVARRVLRTATRLAHTAPFEDVQSAFQAICAHFSSMGLPVLRWPSSPSRFVSADRVVPVWSVHPVIHETFADSFVQWGRVPNLLRLIAWHPEYLAAFYRTYEFIMHGDGPLPIPWRFYIAIMAAARHRCRYLVSQLEVLFLYEGGSDDWLRSLSAAPRKLQDLATVNAFLAHQPWLITRDHIEALARGSDAWSMSELVQALVLLTTFHALTSLAFGCGLVGDDETESEVDAHEPSSPATLPVDASGIERATTVLLDRLRAQLADEGGDGPTAAAPVDRREAFAQAGLDGDVGVTPDLPQLDLFDRYQGGVSLLYRDFDMKASTYTMFRLQDYSWSDHGFELVGRFYSTAAQLLENEFTTTFFMTDRQLNENKDVDTAKFRSAIWFYTQRVYGMSNDDYVYGEVNFLVSRELKAYVKKVTCYPERVTHADFVDMGLALRPEERCHINLLALEARKQAALLYGLHAVMQFMSTR